MNEGRIRTIVLGIFLHEDRLLVFRGDDPTRNVVFYRPLGGGIEFGEPSADAFVREIREELGAELTAVRYLGMLENIFTHAGKRGHEIRAAIRRPLRRSGVLRACRRGPATTMGCRSR